MAEIKRTVEERKLIQAYGQIKDSPALRDILAQLDGQYETNQSKAQNELDNPAKASAYLQRSVVCDNMRLYIRDKLSSV